MIGNKLFAIIYSVFMVFSTQANACVLDAVSSASCCVADTNCCNESKNCCAENNDQEAPLHNHYLSSLPSFIGVEFVDYNNFSFKKEPVTNKVLQNFSGLDPPPQLKIFLKHAKLILYA